MTGEQLRAGSGASALALALEGVKVAICARTADALESTVAELRDLSGAALGIVADIMAPDAAAQIHQQVVDGLGPVDILVNNVGGVLDRTPNYREHQP
ncbi:MAG: SDR family NAD(P)-dependent oxidoreductase [Caldilineaceae bacterium]